MYQVVPFMRGVNFISDWVVVSSPTGPACLFDSSPQSVNMPVYDRIGFKNKIDLWLLLLQGLAIMKMHVCIKTLMRQTSQWVYDVKLSRPKKRKWKLSHRTDTLVKSKYLIISIFSWKEIVKLHETMWPIRDNNTSNGYLFEQESSGETLNTMFVDNRWLISLQYMDVSIPMTL